MMLKHQKNTQRLGKISDVFASYNTHRVNICCVAGRRLQEEVPFKKELFGQMIIDISARVSTCA